MYRRSGKEKESRCLAFLFSTKREIRHFDDLVVQWRQRSVQKKCDGRDLQFLHVLTTFCVIVNARAVKLQRLPTNIDGNGCWTKFCQALLQCLLIIFLHGHQTTEFYDVTAVFLSTMAVSLLHVINHVYWNVILCHESIFKIELQSALSALYIFSCILIQWHDVIWWERVTCHVSKPWPYGDRLVTNQVLYLETRESHVPVESSK